MKILGWNQSRASKQWGDVVAMVNFVGNWFLKLNDARSAVSTLRKFITSRHITLDSLPHRNNFGVVRDVDVKVVHLEQFSLYYFITGSSYYSRSALERSTRRRNWVRVYADIETATLKLKPEYEMFRLSIIINSIEEWKNWRVPSRVQL